MPSLESVTPSHCSGQEPALSSDVPQRNGCVPTRIAAMPHSDAKPTQSLLPLRTSSEWLAGYHVHVQVTHALVLSGTQTFPFLFDDVNSPGSQPGQPTRPHSYTSENWSRLGGCSVNYVPGPALSEADIAWKGIRARARSDSRFGSEIAGSQNSDPTWGGGTAYWRDLRYIDFAFSGGRTVRIFHAFYNNSTSNLGATIFFDPDQNDWAPWITVNP